MKRGAEKQLSKDDQSDGEGQEDSPQVGFRKADESVLATRQIRGLPKRASVASIPPPATEAPSTKFGSFSGFSGTSHSFSGFGTTNSTLAPPPNLFAPSTVTQTSTAKTLTSLLSSHNPTPTTFSTPSSTSASSSASPFTTPPVINSGFTLAPSTNTTSEKKRGVTADPTELKYYTSLRGLNESLRVAVDKAIDDDAFADVTVVLERYKSLRANIQKEFDGNTSSPSSTTSTAASAPVAKTFSMPAVPKEGFIFSGMNSTDTKPSTTSSSGGFVPTPPASSSSTFGSRSIFGASGKPKSKRSDAPITTLPYSFGSKPSDTTPSTSVSIFGAESTEGSKALVSTSSALTPSSLTPPKQPAPIEWDTKSSTSAPLALTNTSDSSTQPKTEKPAITFGSSAPSFSFGSGSSSSFNLTSTKPGDATPATGGGRFAGFAGFSTTKPGGVASTSSSFGFTPSLIAPATAPSLGLTPSPSTLTATASGSSTGGNASTTSDGAANDDAPKKSIAESFALNADNKHDQEGTGEEDEGTAHSVKLKAYVMKDDQGAKSWIELGYGVLRIKTHNETGARRVLLRSSSTGQILINFSFHSAFKPTQKGKNVTFLGHDAEGTSKMYTLKLQTQDQAFALANAFDREIKAKEDL